MAAIVAPATAAPTDPAATFKPAMETNTCARASGGALRPRAAKVAVINEAFASPASAKPASVSG